MNSVKQAGPESAKVRISTVVNPRSHPDLRGLTPEWSGLVIALLLTLPSFAEDAPAPTRPAGTATQLLIQPGDRVLFVGDDLTQQQFYTRASAAGLMAMMPEAQLRFFAGGMEGATAGDALNWIDDLLSMAKPTVVTVCFGSNDVYADADGAVAVSKYKENLSALVQRIKASGGVRRLVLISPPPAQMGIGPGGTLLGMNLTLDQMATATFQVALEQSCDFIDLFEHLRKVYDAANTAGGEPLSFAGKLPTEAGNVVVASMVLWGLGVESQQLEPIGWSPVTPARMRKVRQVLALQLSPVSLEQAQASRELYESMRRHDELFFRAWRLAPRKASGPNRDELLIEANQAWAGVQELAQRVYGKPAPTP